MNINTVHHGDCRAGLAELPDGTIDLAFADPPFNIGYKYDVYDDERAADEYLDWCRGWGGELVRKLKPHGTFWLAIGDDFAAELKVLFQRELGLVSRNWVIWYYTFGVNCKYKFTRSHTHLLYFTRDKTRFTFNADDIRVPSARQLVYADARADKRGRLPDDTWVLRPQDAPEAFSAENDVWYQPRVCGTFAERAGFHGCQMPEQLLGRIIRACSNPGDLVVDPFAGSGSTLVTAKKLGRNFLGYELSEQYVEKLRERVAATIHGAPLEGSANPLYSAPSTPDGPVIRTPAQAQSATLFT